MPRRSYRIWLSLALAGSIVVALAYLFLPFLNEDGYRESLEASFTAALGRPVKLGGAIHLHFSLHPELVLENFSIGSPSWATEPHVLRATRLDIQVSLAPLLQRRLEIEKILIEEADLQFEEGPDGLFNWTLAKKAEPSVWSMAVPQIFVNLKKAGAFTITRSRMAYRTYPPGTLYEASIQEGTMIATDEQMRSLTIKGEFRTVPFRGHFTGGSPISFFNAADPWSLDGVLSIAEVSAVIKAQRDATRIGETLDLHVQVTGRQLSALNKILEIELPDWGPFDIASDIDPSSPVFSLNHIEATIGGSSFQGHLKLNNQADHPTITGAVTATTFQVQDFGFPEKEPRGIPSLSLTASSSHALTSSFPLNVNLDVTFNRMLMGEKELGSASLTITARENHLQVNPLHVQSFGGMMTAHVEMELDGSQTRTIFEGRARSLNYGQALKELGFIQTIGGVMDLDLSLHGQGTSWQSFLNDLTMDLRTGPTAVTLTTRAPEVQHLLVLDQFTLKVSHGGPIHVFTQGTFHEQAFQARGISGPLGGMIKTETSWPFALSVRAGEAALQAKGKVTSVLPDMAGALAFSLRGQHLNQFNAAFPAVGPYQLAAFITKKGSRYRVIDFKSRFGTSDLTGSLEVNLEKEKPRVAGSVTAEQINFSELSRPGDVPVPTESLRAFDADLDVFIKKVLTGRKALGDLTLKTNLQAGRFTIGSLEGKLLDQQSAVTHFQGRIALDTNPEIPTLSGNVSLRDVRYDRLFPGIQFARGPEDVVNLETQFSSTGSTAETLLNQATFSIQGENLQVIFHPEKDKELTMSVRSNLLVERSEEGNLRLLVQGKIQDTPFQIRAAGGPVKALRNESTSWPVQASMEVPHALVELQGNMHLPNPAEAFSFQVLGKATNLTNLNFLSTTALPDAGPVKLNALFTRTPEGYRFTNFQGSLAGSTVRGNLDVTTAGIRPRVTGNLTAELIELRTLRTESTDATTSGETSAFRSMTDSVKDLGAQAFDTLTSPLREKKKSDVSPARMIRDFTLPVEALQTWDVTLDGEIKHLRTGGVDLGNARFQLVLNDGLFTMQPLTGNLWGGELEGSIIIDATNYIPTLEINLRLQGLDYNRMANTFGSTDLVRGQSQSIKLTMKGRGSSLHEILERGRGKFDLVNGPLELTNKYIDLWAADFFTTALSTAWEQKPVSKLNCAVGYFDIAEGELQSDDILIDTQRITIAAIGKLNLINETMDFIFTPQPKDPSLFSLAHTIRIAGPIINPDVSRDKFRIAESGGWAILGLTNPVGWAITIPQVLGTTVGTMNQNPCVAAMTSKRHTAQEIKEIRGGLWGKIKRTFTNLWSDKPHPPPTP